MSAHLAHPPTPEGRDLAASPMTERLVGVRVSHRDEGNGFWFWGLVALSSGGGCRGTTTWKATTVTRP
jgi:hypothetical protein